MPLVLVLLSYRAIRSIDHTEFTDNLKNGVSRHFSNCLSTDDFVTLLKADVRGAFDKLAPLKHATKRVGVRPTARWMTDTVRDNKREARRLQRHSQVTGLREDYVAYRRAGRIASKSIKAARTCFYRDSLLADALRSDSRAKWKMIKEVLHSDDRSTTESTTESTSPSCKSHSLPQSFSS